MKIPFVDLYAQYMSIKKEIDHAIETVLKETSFIGGKHVIDFEKNFAEFLNIKNVIACANGTDSLEILLKAHQISEGDEVIVPAISWISTSECLKSVGAVPVFVDIEENYFTINSELIESKITSKTKAIIPVHLYGHPCNMDNIMEIAKKHNLIVIEDCAQSHAALWNNKTVGTIGHSSSFSFYPGKNLGAYGDAGAMATNNSEIARICKMISNHGQEGKHNHQMEGRNSRLDGLQAAILNVKLNYLNEWTKKRQEIANHYNKMIRNPKILKPQIHSMASHVFHLYVIRTKERNSLIEYLKNNQIDSAIHYPTALPFLPCYKSLNNSITDFPIANQYQNEILSIPMFADMTIEQIEYVSDILNKF